MMVKRKCLTFLFLLMMFCVAATGQAAKSFEEGYYPVGSIFSLNIKNAIYSVSDQSMAELYEKEDGSFGVKCVRPGDVYITAIAKMPDGLYKFTLLAHIFEEDASAETGNNGFSGNSTEQTNFAYEVLRLVNAERARAGASSLRLADDLMYAASIRAQELPSMFSHTRPDGSSCFTAVPDGAYRQMGENIAAGQESPEAVVEGWMHSQGHRENILNPAFSEIGIGFCDAGSQTQYGKYWVQIFRG